MPEEENMDLAFEEEEEEEPPVTSDEIKLAFQSGNALQIEKMLVRLTYHDPDWRRAELYCLEFLDHSDASVRGVAADCIRRLIYKHQELDLNQLLPALYQHRSDPSQYVATRVNLTLNDIENLRHIPIQPEKAPSTPAMSSTSTASVDESQPEEPKKWQGYDIARLTFLDDPLAYQPAADEINIRMPGNAASPKELLDLLTEKLELLPSEEKSWMALGSVLSSWDEWRTTPRRVILIHDALPFLQEDEQGWKQLKLYLTILVRSIGKIQEKNATRAKFEGSRELVVIFPKQMEQKLRTIFARSAARTE